MTARATMGVLAAALLATIAAMAGPAAAESNAKTGALLARHWCGAERPYEERWLRAWLADPHPPMPNFSLSRSEIDDIVAYLRVLSTP